MNRLKTVLEIARQGKTYKDRLVIAHYNLLGRNSGKKYYNHQIILENNVGTWYCGHNPVYIGGSSENYEPLVRKHMDITKGTFLDVGGYVGRHSIEIARRPGVKVHCFEPNFKNYETIKKNVEMNNVAVEVHNVGVSDKKGKGKLYLFEDTSGGHSLIKQDKHNGSYDEVKIVALDDYGFKDVKLIKIDVEDNEINVLKGAKRLIKEQKPRIIFECYGLSYYKQISDFLEDLGYEIERIDFLNYVANPKK